MPETRTNQDLIEESAARRAAIRADRHLDDSDATLRDRARTAIEALERNTYAARSDNEATETVRERARGAVDPVLQARLDNQDRDFAEINRELRGLRQALTVNAELNDLSAMDAERRRKAAMPEYQAYRKDFRDYAAGYISEDGMRASLRTAIQARAVTSDDTSGGFFVPFEIDMRIQRVLQTICAIRGLATVRGISTAVFARPFNVGGSTGSWVVEQDTRLETLTPKLVKMEFTAHEYYAYPFTSQIALEDMNFDVESWLAREVAIVAAELEGAAFISGDGVKKPEGFLGGDYPIIANTSYPTLDQTTPTNYKNIGYVPTGVAAALSDSTHNGEDALIDTVHALRPAYRANGAWLMNDLTLALVRKFKDQYGQYLLGVALGAAGQPEKLLDKPVYIDENMPSVAANAYPIAFADWADAYLIVDRVGMSMLRNPYASLGNIGFYYRRRVGGGLQNFESIKLLKVSVS